MNVKWILCAVAISTGCMAFAQDQVSAGGRPLRMTQIPPQKLGLNSVDAQALRDIAIANMFEIKTSEIAMKRGGSAWTRQYAKEMVHEHTQAQNEVKLMARQKGISLPDRLPVDK
ncbi:MAG TPA: DUF4142 domain-containing protein, partial [Fimbriimonas sp.]